MEIKLHLPADRRTRNFKSRTVTCALPYTDASYVIAKGLECECSRGQDLMVSGMGVPLERTDRYIRSDAGCSRCGGKIGILTVTFDTLFGAEEDNRVLNGRCRVY